MGNFPFLDGIVTHREQVFDGLKQSSRRVVLPVAICESQKNAGDISTLHTLLITFSWVHVRRDGASHLLSALESVGKWGYDNYLPTSGPVSAHSHVLGNTGSIQVLMQAIETGGQQPTVVGFFATGLLVSA